MVTAMLSRFHDLAGMIGLAPWALAGLLALGWLVLVCLAGAVMPRRSQRLLGPALASGVPVLGWLTYVGGPLAGITALIAGLLALTYLLRRLPHPEG